MPAQNYIDYRMYAKNLSNWVANAIQTFVSCCTQKMWQVPHTALGKVVGTVLMQNYVCTVGCAILHRTTIFGSRTQRDMAHCL